MSVPELDVQSLADQVLLELCAQHMLGELEPHVTAPQVAAMGKLRDHRGRMWRVRREDARELLIAMCRRDWVPFWPLQSRDGQVFRLQSEPSREDDAKRMAAAQLARWSGGTAA